MYRVAHREAAPQLRLCDEHGCNQTVLGKLRSTRTLSVTIVFWEARVT